MASSLITSTQLDADLLSDSNLINETLSLVFPFNHENTNNVASVHAAGPSRFGTALGAIFAFLFIIFGLFGDSLILVAILRKRELRNNLVNIFIVSLQLNDIFNISFNQFLVGLSYIFMHFHGPYIICEVFVYTSIICTGSLLWHHALIAVHRYLVVVCNKSTSFMGMSPRLYITLSLIIARLIPTLVCAPALIKRNMTVYSEAALRCLLAPRVSGFQNLLIVVINMLVPCVIVVFCFARIFTKVHRVSRNIHKQIQNNYGIYNKFLHQTSQEKGTKQPQQPLLGANLKGQQLDRNSPARTPVDGAPNNDAPSVPSSPSPMNSIVMTNMTYNNNVNLFTMTMNSMHREIQITKMFAIIFIVFLFGYLPYGIIRMLDKKNSLHPDVYVLLTVLFIISISVSPVIYGLMNNQIRVQCTKLLKMIFDCKNKADKRRSFRTSCYATTGIFNRDSSDDCVNDSLGRRNMNSKKRESLAAKLNGETVIKNLNDCEKTDKTDESKSTRSLATNGKSEEQKSKSSSCQQNKSSKKNTTTNESVSPSKSSKDTLANRLMNDQSIYDNVSNKSKKDKSKSLNSNEPSPKHANPFPNNKPTGFKMPLAADGENASDEDDGGVYKGPPGWLQ